MIAEELVSWMSFKYKVRPYTRYSYINGEVFTQKTFGIGVQSEGSNIIIPSPITNYLKSRHSRKGKSINSIKSVGDEIVKFLNFCIDCLQSNNTKFIELKDKGLYGLDLKHGSEYISYQTSRAENGDIQPNYIYRIEGMLIDFYKWLQQEKIVQIPELEEFIQEGCEGSPFDDVELGTLYPGKKEHLPDKIVDFGENRISLAYKFIQTAEIVAPEIALGICFQFFGGLRKSEVVNLTRKSFIEPSLNSSKIGSQKPYLLKILDNQAELFPKQSYIVHEQVKNPRMQSIIPFSIIGRVLKRHLKELNLLKYKGKLKNESAVFVDYKDGNPINGQQYYRRFMKVKEKFLQILSEEQHIDFDFLNENRWSTHIGRGVFTNILLERGADIVSVKVARGDKTLDTILKYVEEKRAVKFTQEAINELNEELKKRNNKFLNTEQLIEATIDLEEINWGRGDK